MTLKKRIDRLAEKSGRLDGEVPTVIFLCEADGEAQSALMMGGDTLTRDKDETESAFIARASDGTARVVSLPDNGNDALASGEAPIWAHGKLTIRALRAKHSPDK